MKKILLVEDDKSTSLIIQKQIKSLGYQLCAAVETGEEAIKCSINLCPDIILMDIQLKAEMNGIDSAKYISKNLSIPTIFITSDSHYSTIDQIKSTNPFGFIIKPVERNELRAAVEIAFIRHRMDTALEENEFRLQSILSSIPHAIFVTDFNNIITYLNPASELLLNMPKNEIIYKPLDDIIVKKTLGKMDSSLDMKLYNGDDTKQTFLLACKDRSIPVELKKTQKKNILGEVSGYVITIINISDEIEYSKKLSSSLARLQKSVSAIIETISLTIETRDPYTAGHQKRVTEIARKISMQMHLSNDMIEGITMAGKIHDLGKISIPAEILSKPGPVTDIEYNIIKNHPKSGYDILKSIDFPWPVAQIIYQHHERLDGSGYPRGLKSDEILLEAKIIAVADVVEAMVSHRPYRPSLGIEAALKEISDNINVLYDEEVVHACIRLFKLKGYSLEDRYFYSHYKS